MNESQLHAGHRERMTHRFLSYPESLNDHEILEILLYNLVPRIDTNPLAHKLLRVFGSLEAIFNADMKQLLTVEGVGRKVAAGIMVIGNVFERVFIQKTTVKPKQERWATPEIIVRNLRKIIKDYETEKFVMVLLNGNFVKLAHLDFEDKSKDSVTMDVPEVLSAFAVYRPKLAIVAHNHPSKKNWPSLQDDFTTKKLNILCEIHNVRLIDHVILTDTDKFSYHCSDRMDYVREEADLVKLLNQIKENSNE